MKRWLNKNKKKFKLIFPFLIPLFLGAIFLESLISTFIFALFLFIFFPFFLVHIWGCKPIPSGETKERLEGLALKANFKYAAFLNWPPLNHYITAAIVGSFHPLRYVLFSEVILKKFSINSIEAILSHEIGHSYWKHLYFLPLVLCGGLFVSGHVAHELSYPNDYLYVLIFFMTALIWARYVYSYYSRLFERQADLYGLELDLPLQWMINAFEEVSFHSGKSAHAPARFHYSIHDRIQFLKKVQLDPSLIKKHYFKVRVNIILYIIFFVGLCFLTYGLD